MMNYFLLQGGPECLVYFQNKRHQQIEWHWTSPKTAKVGDIAFVYLTAPLSRIVGRVEITDEPFHNYPNRFENDYMKNKWCAEVGWRETFDLNNPQLALSGLKLLFGVDWSYLRYPRGNTVIPEHIKPAFLELMGEKQ